jgi:multimeric flavodoxin WrbA
MKVKILGVSGTPVKDGNCDKLVQVALKAAEEIEGVETSFVTLADKEIAMCQHCQYCIENKTGCKIQDDAQAIYQQMKDCDGIIMGAPTWIRTIAPPLLILLSRTRYQIFLSPEFRNKVVGALTLGWFGRGMDITTMEILHMVLRYNMIPVAEGAATTSSVVLGQRAGYMEQGVLDNKMGITQARGVGYRVAEVARMIKYSIDNGIVAPPEFQFTSTGASGKSKKSG